MALRRKRQKGASNPYGLEKTWVAGGDVARHGFGKDSALNGPGFAPSRISPGGRDSSAEVLVAVSSNFLVVVGLHDLQLALVEKQAPLASWDLWRIRILVEERTIVYEIPICSLGAVKVETCLH